MVIDIFFAVCLIYGFYLGFKNEPMNKLFKLLPYLLGLLTGIYIGPFFYDKLAEMVGSDGVGLFLITFLICFFLGWSFSKYLAEMFTIGAKKMNIKKPEKVLNGITLAFFFIIIFSGLISFLNKASVISVKEKESSLSLATVESLPVKVKESVARLKPGFKKFIDKSNEVIEKKEPIN